MRRTPTTLCLFLLACSLNSGCANPEPDEVNIPLEIEHEADVRQPRDPRREWVSEFGAQIEASSNARLALLPGNPTVAIDGVTAAYGEGSTSVTSVAVAVISVSSSSNVVSAVQNAVLHAIQKERIPRAEIGFKKDGKSPVHTSCVVVNPQRIHALDAKP
jgi:hypothetical protein